MTIKQRNFEFIGAYIDGRASDSEVQQLEDRLTTDPDFRRLFLEHLNVDSALATHANSVTSSPTRIAPRRSLPVSSRWLAAACVIAAAGLALWNLTRPPGSGTGIEIIASSADSGYSPGEQMSTERLTITDGWLNVQLESGALLEISGPADIEIVDEMHVRVDAGGVTVDVGDYLEGFIIDTVTARIVDLGTRFAVAVDSTGTTDVVVFDGEVSLHEPDGGPSSASYESLYAGEALSISAPHSVSRLTAVAMTPGVARLSSAGPLSVVTSVSDNMTDSDYRRFYGLVPGGMRENAPAYTTIGRARWHPRVDEDFPAELIGADAVHTFHDDRRNRELQIMLELAAPSAVYVMVDTRNATPDWLQDAFTDTGLQLRTGPWRDVGIVDGIAPEPDGGLYVTYRVWKREVLSAGSVVLGQPRTPGQPGNRAMYGIAVQAL